MSTEARVADYEREDMLYKEQARLVAELAALAARHEKALVEGAARLAERDEARAQIAEMNAEFARRRHELSVALAQIAAKDAQIMLLNELATQRTAMIDELLGHFPVKQEEAV